MRLDVRDRVPGHGGDRLQRADLVGDHALDLGHAVAADDATAEAVAIVEAGMRADGDAVGFGDARGLVHHVPVAAMKAAGDIGRRDDLQHRRIVTHASRRRSFRPCPS